MLRIKDEGACQKNKSYLNIHKAIRQHRAHVCTVYIDGMKLIWNLVLHIMSYRNFSTKSPWNMEYGHISGRVAHFSFNTRRIHLWNMNKSKCLNICAKRKTREIFFVFVVLIFCPPLESLSKPTVSTHWKYHVSTI